MALNCLPVLCHSHISCVTPGEAQFWPQGHYLNKLGSVPLGDTTYQISRFSPCGFLQEDFIMLEGSFKHPKHMFKLMDKKIITILRIYFWLNWPYDKYRS